ncbi:MAG: DUF4351 domain-containing protein, partial [Cyanobacteria bacterium J06639_1]
IEWIVNLPPEAELEYQTELAQLQQEESMPYLSAIERTAQARGIEQGIEQERRSLIRRQLTRKLGTLSAEVLAQLNALSPTHLEELSEALLDFDRLEDLQTWLDSMQ